MHIPSYVTLSAHIIAATCQSAAGAAPDTILESGKEFHRFRGDVYIDVQPHELTTADVKIINDRCDAREPHLNKVVKEQLSASLSQHFNSKAFHVTEFGSGSFPLIKYWPDRHDISFTAIERDEDCLRKLHRMNVVAAPWAEAQKIGIPPCRPSIVASVFAMHFMVDSKLPRRIEAFTSQDGFFVGNFYKDIVEQETGTQRTKMANILDRQNLEGLVVSDPTQKSTEYWIIGRADNMAGMEAFASTLKAQMGQDSYKPAGITVEPIAKRYAAPQPQMA